MKKFYFFLLVFLISFFCLHSFAFAAQFGNLTEENIINENSKIDDNYITAAADVTINSDIEGDLIILAGTTRINGNVKGNLIVVARQADVNSQINGNIYAACGQLKLKQKAKILGDVFSVAGTLTTNGSIQKKLYSITQLLNINGKVKEGFTAKSQQIILGSEAQILGDIKYTAVQKMKKSSNAKISAKINEKITSRKNQKQKFNKIIKQFASNFLSLIGALIVGVILLFFFPKFSEKVRINMKKNFWTSIGWGLLTWIIIPIIISILILFLIGLPLAMILLALYFMLIYLSKIFVGLCFGMYITKEKLQPIWAMSIGLVILYLIGIIPYFGNLVNFAIILIGFGAVLLSLYQKTKLTK